MRSGFTLLEVIIAATIIAFMSLGILQMQSNTTHNLSILNNQTQVSRSASAMLSQPYIKYHQKSQTLYEFLKDRYIIDYDPLIRELKKGRLTFSQKESGHISLDMGKLNAEQEGTFEGSTPEIGLLLKINQLTHDKKSAQTLTFENLQ